MDLGLDNGERVLDITSVAKDSQELIDWTKIHDTRGYIQETAIYTYHTHSSMEVEDAMISSIINATIQELATDVCRVAKRYFRANGTASQMYVVFVKADVVNWQLRLSANLCVYPYSND